VSSGHSPFDDLIDHRGQVSPWTCQPVLDPRGNDGVLNSINQSACLEALEFPAENSRCHWLSLARDHDRPPELTVAARAPEELPQDPQLVFPSDDLVECDQGTEPEPTRPVSRVVHAVVTHNNSLVPSTRSSRALTLNVVRAPVDQAAARRRFARAAFGAMPSCQAGACAGAVCRMPSRPRVRITTTTAQTRTTSCTAPPRG
jgi:hypothetical protein